ncbi:MAG: ribosomal RNA small subunit methyltransferase A [Alphaproteobacteria bacterium]|nr:ribosomal RNA small subunit methyltransferase A [Alphaproteobacteria bacterium]
MPYSSDDDFDLSIAQVIKKYGLLDDRKRAKSLGQHFLCDMSLLEKIVSCALPFGDCDLIEIGAGPGGLTRAIMKHAGDRSIFCLEKDTSPSLQALHNNMQQHSDVKLHFVYEDALRVKPQNLTDRRVIIISNLPYNVGTQILLNLLHDLSRIDKLVLMFQKEVADRICARPGTKDYGRLSVISQLLCHTEKLFDVANTAFFPPPKVVSTVVKMTPLEVTMDLPRLEQLTALCFQHRRKTIFSSLKREFPAVAEKALTECGIDKMDRPENVPPMKFLELSMRLNNAKL